MFLTLVKIRRRNTVLPRKKSGKRQWTDPVILVPIIVAIITAIVGPTYVYLILNPPTPPKTTTTPTPTPPPAPTQYSFVRAWGSEGSGDEQFEGPRGISIDLARNVYVADTGNNRITKFDSNGS
jgi:hypothetical protein